MHFECRGFYIRRRQHLVYTFGCVSLFVLMTFFLSRLVNYISNSDRKTLLVIDLNRDRFPSRWNYGSAENFTNPSSSSLNVSLPIAFYNDTDVKNLTLLWKYIRQINEAHVIRNSDRFGDEPPLFIIIIQVHNRSTHLMYLIESLRKVRYIEKALVVFSHDFFSPETNRMLEALRFMRFTQIFFPYSQQLFPNSYPGPHPKDCHKRSLKRSLLSFVMNKMNISQNFFGWCILLEEDYVVLPDMLHVLRLTEQYNASFDIVALGSYETSQSFNSPDHVYTSTWASPKHNMGMAFKQSLYDRVKHCFKAFCLYDDYNWDWSFSFIDRTCLNPRLRVLHFKNCGRVFHTGSCGLHSKGRECDNVEASIKKVMDQTSSRLSQNLFPKSLAVSPFTVHSAPKANGGWSDPRDLGLCLAILNNRWEPLVKLLPVDVVKSRRLDVFDPLIPGVSDSKSSVL
ncbi:hypothetical protein ACTXT7_009611 [Hymenolepis weldensis]